MMDSSHFLLAVALLLVVLWIWDRKKPKNFPPGPVGFPIVGYFPFLGKQPYKTFVELGKKYGNVFSVKLGPSNVVVLNDWNAIKEAMVIQGDIFNGRPRNILYDVMFDNDDVAFIDGKKWKERRKFTIQHLKSLGLGKSSLENVISDEIGDLINKLEGPDNETIEIYTTVFPCFIRIIWSIVGGKISEYDDKLLNEFFVIVKDMFQGMSNTHPLFYMPYLRFVFPKDFNGLRANVDRFNRFLQNAVDQHVDSYREENLRDFVDACLKVLYSRQKSSQNDIMEFKKDTVIHISKVLFLGGTDSSTNTLSWGLLYMAVWPSFQQKVQQELDSVIGRERLPTYNDRKMLPYCYAVVLENQRYASVAALSVVHSSVSETKLFGYTVPEGTIVMENLWATHFDPKYWGDPEVYRPERFLDKDGRIIKPEYFMPFGVGERMCLGKSLGEMNAFLFFTSLLHRFTFSLKPGEKLPDFEPIYSLTLSPQPFPLVVKKR